MSLIEIMERFPTQESCYEFLEGIRFKEGAYCPHCASIKVGKKREKKHVGRWNCHDCRSSFRVTKGTIFHDTKIPLQKWFLGIILIANAKKSLSSHQLARDLDMNQKSAWYMMTRIRAEMASKNDTILKGIIEADETYIGGKPRKPNKRDDDDKTDTKQGWTKKKPVIGLAERGGNVLAKAVDSVTGVGVLEFILGKVDTEESVLMTDESNVYQNVERIIERKTVNHKEQYVDGDVHTNTLEGFWGLLKRAWYGQHHKYKVRFMPLYVAEAVWKYNNRKRENVFDFFVKGCFA